jgi:hypothetical protein
MSSNIERQAGDRQQKLPLRTARFRPSAHSRDLFPDEDPNLNDIGLLAFLQDAYEGSGTTTSGASTSIGEALRVWSTPQYRSCEA